AFDQSFALAAMGTVADAAQADLVLVPVNGLCRTCSAEFESNEPIIACPACAGLDVEQSGGDELTLELIEYRS
ncbi:MAG TPA: hydrogenase maturation nickel metallochaperone HypA, partial [Acidimicrobiales bacterium]|nr:hydrogenase maturation nickel metallochaperone HypA [Acidimicrobiales bacterium]